MDGSLVGDLRRAHLIARLEFRRTIRSIAGDRSRLALTAGVALLAIGPLLAVGVLILPAAGETLATSEVAAIGPLSARDVATGGVAVAWLFVLALSIVRTTTTVADVDEPAGLLLATSTRSVAGGLIGAEWLRLGSWMLASAVAFGGAFAYGYGSPLPVALVLAVCVLCLGSAMPLGFLVGVWVRHALTTYDPIARHRTVLILAIGAVYFGTIATGTFDRVLGELVTLLAGSPLGWPGHLLLVAVPSTAPAWYAVVAAVVGAVGVAAVSLELGGRSAAYHWFADPARSPEPVGRSGGESTRLADLLASLLGRQARTVAVTAIRRARRSPVRLLYAAYPLLGVIFFAEDVIARGHLPTVPTVLLFVYVIWGAGVLFTLNPLGDPGGGLPALVTTPVSGRSVMAGLVVAGALVGVPAALLVGLVAGVASTLALETTAMLTAGAALGAVASPALATGIGAAFPRFGSVRVTGNREAVMPSKTAFLVYSVGVLVPVAAAGALVAGVAELAMVVSGLLSLLPALEVSASPALLTAMAWVALAAGLLAPPASLRVAVSRFDRFTLD